MNGSQPDDIRNEALRKVGRNIVNLQKMERAMKILLVRSDLKGYLTDLKDEYEKRVQKFEQATMGGLVNNLVDTVYSPTDSEACAPDEQGGAWVSFGFRIEGGCGQKEAQKEALSLVVKERNYLVHQMLSDFDSASVESCRTLIDYLDGQHERITPQFDRVMGWLKFLDEGQRIVSEVMINELGLGKEPVE